MTLTGTLTREDIGTGVYILTDASGRRLHVQGPVPSSAVGKRVRIEGRAVQDQGFGMAGTDGAIAFADPSALTPL